MTPSVTLGDSSLKEGAKKKETRLLALKGGAKGNKATPSVTLGDSSLKEGAKKKRKEFP